MRKILFLFILVGFVFSSSSWADSGDPVIEGKSITGALGFDTGTTIDEFSTDGTFAGNSDNALPTEKAIKTYGDANWIGDHFIAPGAGTLSTAAAAASDGDVLWLKEGLYTETVPITITSKSLSIIGAGPEVSIIRCTGTHGIVVDTNAVDKHVTLENFTIETTSAGTYTAIQLEAAVSVSNCNKMFYVRNLNIKPYNLAADYWLVGIKLIQAWNSVIDGCIIRGKNNDLSMSKGIELLTNTVDVTITNTHFYFMSYGIKAGSAQNEGIMVSNNVMVYVNYGIYCIFSVGESWAGIVNNHISTFYRGICFSNLHETKIIGNLLYKRHDSAHTWIGIDIITGKWNNIDSNQIKGSGSGGTENGIVLGSSTLYNIISNNIVSNQDTGILLQSGAHYNIVNANITEDCTNEITDSGTGNSVTDNLAI